MERHQRAGMLRIRRVTTGMVGKIRGAPSSRIPPAARARCIRRLADRRGASARTRFGSGVREAGTGRATAGAPGSARTRAARRQASARGSSSASARVGPRRSGVRGRRDRARDRTNRPRTAAPSAIRAAPAPRNRRRRPRRSQAGRVLFDEDAFATAGVEHARVARQGVEPLPDGCQLRDVGGVVVPVGVGLAMIVAAGGVLAVARTTGELAAIALDSTGFGVRTFEAGERRRAELRLAFPPPPPPPRGLGRCADGWGGTPGRGAVICGCWPVGASAAACIPAAAASSAALAGHRRPAAAAGIGCVASRAPASPSPGD